MTCLNVGVDGQVKRGKRACFIIFHRYVQRAARLAIRFGRVWTDIDALERDSPHSCDEDHSAEDHEEQITRGEERELVVVYEAVDD